MTELELYIKSLEIMGYTQTTKSDIPPIDDDKYLYFKSPYINSYISLKYKDSMLIGIYDQFKSGDGFAYVPYSKSIFYEYNKNIFRQIKLDEIG